MDPPEELGAFASSRIGVGTTAFYEGIVFVGGVAASEVGAVEDLVEPRVASLAGEGLRREEVPWRRVQVVSGDGLGLGRDVVHLVEDENGKGEEGESGNAGEEMGRRSGHVSLLLRHDHGGAEMAAAVVVIVEDGESGGRGSSE